MMLRVTDLKQWAYCRIHCILPSQNAWSRKADLQDGGVGKAAQDMVEQLEMRRTMREYGFEGAIRKFGVWLENEDLGLAGKLDLLLETDTEAAIVEFKPTSGEAGQNHRLQLAGCGGCWSRESWPRQSGVGSSTGFRTGRYFRFPLTKPCGARSARQWLRCANLSQTAALPEPTDVRKRCEECEYANYCGDVW